MIFNSIQNSIKTIILNPFILLPALILSIFSVFLDNIIGLVLQRPLADLFLFGAELLNENIAFVILTQYYPEVFALILLGLITLFLSTIAWATISRVVNSKTLTIALNESVMEWKKALGLSASLYIIGFVFFVLLILITIILTSITPFFGNEIATLLNLTIIPLILSAVLFFFLVKILFVFATITQEKGKKIIQKSVAFSNKKMFSTFAIILISFIIYYLITSVFWYGGLIFQDFEILFFIAGQTLAFSFFALTISSFYFLK